MASVLGAALWVSGCAYGDQDEVVGDDVVEVAGGIDPVIFIHGCPHPPHTHAETVQFFQPMKNFFLANGYPSNYLITYQYEPYVCDSAVAQAQYLSNLVQQTLAATGRSRVDIVAWSFGALPARVYLAQGGNRYVRDFFMVGAPNHGTDYAVIGLDWQDMFGAPRYEGVQEMYPAYACQGETYGGSADIQFLMNGCLTDTGRTVYVDETPNGGVDYMSVRNNQTQEIYPLGSACLNQRFKNDCADTRVNFEVSIGSTPGPCGPPGVPALCPPDVSVIYDPLIIGMAYNHVSHPDDGDDVGGNDGDDDSD